MLDLLFLIGAVALLIAMQLLRTVLAFVFSKGRVRPVATFDVPASIADLHDEAAGQLVALGYAGPQWYMLDYEDEADTIRSIPVAVWTHANGNACWLLPHAGADKPNRLNVIHATRLADGRTAASQAFDPYCLIVSTPQQPGRMIGGDTFAAQVADHDAWIATLGAPPDPDGTSPAALDAFGTRLLTGARERLVADGKAWVDSRGLARPTLRSALSTLRHILKRPRPSPNLRPIPPARLAALAELMQRVAERPAPRRMQAVLFAVSVALFLALGAVFWGASFAVVLLVVITIHELGHFLAMRKFGYRNVQMLALPLVGGVTIGHEVKPDAARRAWMSLAGPLPGIVIGWCMVAALVMVDDLPSWWLPATITFLALNYLNVLPVPPLDGGHVVQALLPVRGARAQALFIVVFCLLGAYAAVYYEQFALAVIALFQLLGAAPLWRLSRLVTLAQQDAGVAPALPREARLERIFEIADATFGTVVSAGPRMGQAMQALRALDVAPMRAMQRTAITAVYVALLAVPVVAGAWWLVQPKSGYVPPPPEVLAQQKQEGDARTARVAALDFATLMRDVASPLPAPASPEDIEAAERRLGVALPEDLAAFYRLADGAPGLGISPLAALARVGARPDFPLASFVDDGKVYTFSEEDDDAPVGVGVDDVRGWLLLTPRDAETPLAYDLAEKPAHAGLRTYVAEDGDIYGYRDLRRWIERQRVFQIAQQERADRLDASVAAAMPRWAKLAMPDLIDALPKPAIVDRVLRRPHRWSPAPPATSAAVEATERRLGTPLPDDMRALYARRNGIYGIHLLRVEDVRPVDLSNGVVRRYLQLLIEDKSARRGTQAASFPASLAELDGCRIVGGADAQAITAILLWCPQLDEARRYIDLYDRRTFATLSDYVRDALARIEARTRR